MILLGLLLVVSGYSYPGCTDPIALNYDPEATEDNGTCVYSVGPDLIQIDMNIINWYCNSLNIPVYQYQATVTNIGTEPVTYFCLDDFLTTNVYQCYNGTVNPAVYVEPGDTVTVGGSIQVSNGWLTGQSNFMTIVSVPGEIITGNNNFVFQMPEGLNCNEIEPEECDTIYITETITVIEYITEFVTDTIYITDTVFVDVIVDNYIFVTDTVIEYVVQTEYIDCETGLPCEDDPGIIVCPDWTTIHISNAFTPNNDGINDTWQLIYDLDCWETVEFWIYNRWGNEVYHKTNASFDSYPYWNGSVKDSNHYVSDGVYIYVVHAKKFGSTQHFNKTGHVSVFR